MSEEMITKNQDAKANCWQCGYEEHYILECYMWNLDNREEIVKVMVSVTQKANPDDHDNSCPAIDENAIITTICKDFAVEEKRIWKINSDEGKNF
jgi:hypothetical protein